MDSPYLENQMERKVEVTPDFNGSNCLVCINVPAHGSKLDTEWLSKHISRSNPPNITDAELDASIAKTLTDALKNCAKDKPVKVQFLYHYSGGYVYERDADGKVGRRHWSQKDTVARVLRKLQQDGNNRIGKVYLTGCSSQEDKHVIDAAFSLTSVKHVVTINTTVLLGCGEMTGAGWDSDKGVPTFEDIPYKIIVWEKENGKQVANVPEEEIDKDHRFNLHTNKSQPKSEPMTGPCPTTHPISGSNKREMRYYGSVASAVADAVKVARGAAEVDAGLERNGHDCTNPKCKSKRVQRLRVTVTSSSGHSAWFRNIFYSDKKYYLKVSYTWKAEVLCS